MGKKTISISISEIDKAIQELNKYKTDFHEKCERCRNKIAKAIAEEAQRNFDMAGINDVIKSKDDFIPRGMRKPQVTVTVSPDVGISVVVADGEDAVWCEFGSGVFHNGGVGTSPNPLGGKLGFTIGSYGEGKGKQSAWGYYDEKPNWVITRGTPASMPMYRASQTIASRVVDIAREVFG